MDGLIIAILIVFALLGAPLFAVFGAAGLILFAKLPNTSITGAANDVFSEKFADSPMLVTIPLFTFAGYLMAESGTPRRLVELSRAWLGWLPGGLAIVCLAASAFFTSFTGGSGITIVAIGGLLFPALIADKYPEKFSLGLVTTGGSLGLLFPPSLPMILYGVVAGVLIEKLFLAGIIPGTITVLALAAYAILIGARSKMPRTRFDANKAFGALWRAKWEVLLPVALLGGLYTGALRIHEAAAFTAIYVLIIEVWVYRDVSFRVDLPRVMRESLTLVGAILIILATAIGFTAYLIQAQVPMKILEAMETLIQSPVMFLIVLNLFLIATGMLMDIFSAIVVVVPLIVPIAAHFGVDPYHLGIVFLLNLEIGYMTPPVGLNLFISSFRFGKPVTLLYKAVLPFIGILLVALGITTYIPELSTMMADLLESDEVMGDLYDEPSGGGDDVELEPLPEGDGGMGAAPSPTLDELAGDGGAGTADGGVPTLDDLGGGDGGGGGGTLDDLEKDLGGGGGGGGGTLDDLEKQLE
ncbi:MAG: TRAP transporter large permease [Polyangiales bacterium]